MLVVRFRVRFGCCSVSLSVSGMKEGGGESIASETSRRRTSDAFVRRLESQLNSK